MARARWPWHRSNRRLETPAVSGDDIADLLEKVRQLRTTLTADLSAAAGALDDEQPEVARDIIAADQTELRKLAAPAIPRQRLASQRHRRVLLALPAVPLVGALAITGAAALSSNSSHHQPTAGSRSVVAAIDTPAAIQQTATTTLRQLERVVAARHHQRRVVTVAAHLHHQLTALITTAPDNAKELGEVQRLLAVEQQLLESHHGEGTAIALAASRHLNDLLAAAGLPTAIPSIPTMLPTIAIKPTRAATASPTPKSTTVKTTKPHPSTSPSSVVSSPPPPSQSPTPTQHHHHHRHHLTNPLAGTGLLNNAL